MKTPQITKDELIHRLVKSKKESQDEIRKNAVDPVYIEAMNKLKKMNRFQ